MILTLYKGCKLNDSYKNVFCQTNYEGQSVSPFLLYLSNLPKKQIDLDTSYQEDTTSFTFYLKDTDYNDIYEYNYMQIQTLASDNQPSITRYAFINSIKIMNEVAVIDYKIDIWHTFAPKILGLNKSYLKGLRVIDKQNMIIPNYVTLPVDYQGNDQLSIPNQSFDENSRVMIILQLQCYNSTTYGTSSVSESRYIVISSYYDFTGTVFEEGEAVEGNIATRQDIKFKNVDDLINNILNLKSKKCWTGSVDLAHCERYLYFDIGNIYILPYIDTIESVLSVKWYGFMGALGNISHELIGANKMLVGREALYTEIDKLKIFKSELITPNFKRVSSGILTMQIPCIENKTTYISSIYISISYSSFKIFLSVQNKFVDITDHFRYFALFNQANGDTIAQQNIAKELQNRNNILSLVSSIGGVARSGVSGFGEFARGNVNYARGMVANDMDLVQDRVSEGAFSSFSMLNIASGITGMASGITGMGLSTLNLGLSLMGYSAKRKSINAPVYNSSVLLVANNIAILNAKYLLCSFYINADNDNYVKESINNIGYNIYEYIDDWNKTGINFEPTTFTSLNIMYNVVQFGTSDVYGNFPLNIKKSLDLILMNGIKIWYNYAIDDTNDTYVVG